MIVNIWVPYLSVFGHLKLCHICKENRSFDYGVNLVILF